MAVKNRTTRRDKINASFNPINEKYSPTYIIPNRVQHKLVESINNKSITVVTGSPGTGKTLFSIQSLYKLYTQQKIDSIIIARLIHESDKEKIGALPGDLLPKLQHRLMSVQDNLERFLTKDKAESLIRDGIIQILPILYLQGRTFYRKGIIVEEAQNLDAGDIFMTLTRLGEGSKMVLNGDDKQCLVRRKRGGMAYLTELLSQLDPDIGVVNLPDEFIERHPLIEKIVRRSYELGGKYEQES